MNKHIDQHMTNTKDYLTELHRQLDWNLQCLEACEHPTLEGTHPTVWGKVANHYRDAIITLHDAIKEEEERQETIINEFLVARLN